MSKKTATALLTLIACVGALLLSDRADGAGGTLVLVVTDAVTGEPVRDATYSLVRDGKPYVRSEQSLRRKFKQWPVRSADELLVLAYGYELLSRPVGGARRIEVALTPCAQHFALTADESVADRAGLRVSVMQSLRRDPQVMLIHAAKEYEFNSGQEQVSLPVPGGLLSKALALHKGDKATHPFAFALTASGATTVSNVPLKSLQVRAIDEDGGVVKIAACILTPDFAVEQRLSPELADALGVRHLASGYQGIPRAGGLMFSGLPPVPMHLLIRTKRGWAYGAVDAEQRKVALRVQPGKRAARGVLERRGRAAEQRGWILPGWLDLACIAGLHASGLLDDIGTPITFGESLPEEVLVDPDARVTLWSPEGGFSFGKFGADGVLSAEPQPGSISIQRGLAKKAERLEVSLIPTLRGRGSVLWGTGAHPGESLRWSLPETGLLTVAGLPISGYRVVVSLYPSKRRQVVQRVVGYVELTDAHPAAALRLTERGIEPVGRD